MYQCRGTILLAPGNQDDYMMVMLKGEAIVRCSQSRGAPRSETRQAGEQVAPLGQNTYAMCIKDSIVIYMSKVRTYSTKPHFDSCAGGRDSRGMHNSKLCRYGVPQDQTIGTRSDMEGQLIQHDGSEIRQCIL